MSSIQPHGVGPNARIPNSSTTTSSIKAGTLQLGNNPSSLQKRSARASDHYASRTRKARRSGGAAGARPASEPPYARPHGSEPFRRAQDNVPQVGHPSAFRPA